VSLRIVLLGTGEFALPPFRALIESADHTVVGVYTQPERSGRGHHSHVNKVKSLAEDHDVAVFQPERVNAPEVIEELRSLNADVFIVAAYGQIMKPEFLAIPRLGAFNLHGSLLPRHRGAAPVQYSIWKGDADAGVTIFQIEPSLDSGPMVGKVSSPIGPKETSGKLMLRLAELSVDLTLDVIAQLDNQSAVFEPQDTSKVTLSPKIKKEEGVINWQKSAAEIDCHVRAMNPWPKASTWLHTVGRKPLRCIFLDAEPVAGASLRAPAGTIDVSEKQFWVHTADGVLNVLSLQPEGKKAMDGMAFLNGYGIAKGAVFKSEA
jgi:methionyl-tRNA formyltransferase